MRQYSLCRHVYVCLMDDQAILLDLRRNKYLGLSRTHAGRMHGFVTGWPVTRAPESAHSNIGADSSWLAEELTRRGVLTTDRCKGKDATPVVMEAPGTSLLDDEFESPPCVQFADAANFLWACAGAWLALRFHSLEYVVHRTSLTTERLREAPDFDNAREVRRLSLIFYRLRPFLFTAKDACLFDSLALTRFLSRYGLAAHWVFGVRSAPFAAHCWVQRRDFVCNGSADYVRAFTPIMVV